MDRLARNAMLARQAGMSYGKWKAMQPIVEVKKKPVLEGWEGCKYCGEFFEGKQGKKFCSDDCRREAYREKNNAFSREYQRRLRARLKEAAANG